MVRIPLLHYADLVPIVLDDLLSGSFVRKTAQAADTPALLDDPILAWSSFHAAMLRAVVLVVPGFDASAMLQQDSIVIMR